MALMDTVKRAMNGRSKMVEKAIDGAVDRIGKYSETLKKRGEGLKAHARRLDGGRTEDPVTDGPPTTAPTASGTEAAEAAPGTSLRGDLAPRDVGT